MIDDAGSSGWKLIARSGSGVVMSHSCCAGVIGASKLADSEMPAQSA